MIIVDFICTTFKESTKGVLHSGDIPFVICPRCGATHVLIDKKFSAIDINALAAQLKQKEESQSEDSNEKNNNKS